MSKSSFYYLFSAKAELYDFVIAELFSAVAADMPTVDPEEFAGDEFWQRLADYFLTLLGVSHQREDFLLLGRMFYSQAPDPARSVITGTLTAVHGWVTGVLRVGRACGAVRTDLPMELQADLVFRILQVFDEWTIAHYADFAPADLQALADAQFATIRRTLAP